MSRYIVTPHRKPLAYNGRERSLVIEAATEEDAARLAAHHIGDLSDGVLRYSDAFRGSEGYWNGSTHVYYVREYVAPPAGKIVEVQS